MRGFVKKSQMKDYEICSDCYERYSGNNRLALLYLLYDYTAHVYHISPGMFRLIDHGVIVTEYQIRPICGSDVFQRIAERLGAWSMYTFHAIRLCFDDEFLKKPELKEFLDRYSLYQRPITVGLLKTNKISLINKL